jgi:hypothetical protein
MSRSYIPSALVNSSGNSSTEGCLAAPIDLRTQAEAGAQMPKNFISRMSVKGGKLPVLWLRREGPEPGTKRSLKRGSPSLARRPELPIGVWDRLAPQCRYS